MAEQSKVATEQKSPITLEELNNYTADEWSRLIRNAFERSVSACVALAAGKGDDVIDALGAALGRIGQNSQRTAAHVLERQLAEMTAKGAFDNEAQISRVQDILALLGSLKVLESLDTVSAILEDVRNPISLRVCAADTLVSCRVRLPKQILEEVQQGEAGSLIGPVLEEGCLQDPRRCLEFIKSVGQVGADDLVFVEYPIRQAVTEVGLSDTVAILDLTEPSMAEPLRKLVEEIISVTFGEDALSSALNKVAAKTNQGLAAPTKLNNEFSDEEQGNLEGTISKKVERQLHLVLLCATAYAQSLVPPTGTLLAAVKTNLKNSVRYTFFVSKKNSDKIDEYKEKFMAQLGEEFNKYSAQVTVAPYKDEWSGNTVIFYFFGDPRKPYELYKYLIGLVGGERGVALSPTWEIMSDDVAKTLLSVIDIPDSTKLPEQRKLQVMLLESSEDPVPASDNVIVLNSFRSA